MLDTYRLLCSRRWFIAALTSALLIASTSGQVIEPPLGAEEDAEVEEIRRYTVELIIFEYDASVSDGGEIFLPDDPPPAEEPQDIPVFGDATTELPVELPPPDIDPAEVELEEITVPTQVDMLLLDREAYSMSGIYDMMDKLDAYHPVMWTGWTQATVDRDLAPPIRLRVLGDPPLRLDGSMTLYLSRYLHLVVDLTMDADAPQQAAFEEHEGAVFGDSRTQFEFGYSDELAAPPVRYRILENRIVRNGDLRYFDHPKFGVLAKVTRFEAPDGEDDDTEFLLPGGVPEPVDSVE